jgi:hypothetical protein
VGGDLDISRDGPGSVGPRRKVLVKPRQGRQDHGRARGRHVFFQGGPPLGWMAVAASLRPRPRPMLQYTTGAVRTPDAFPATASGYEVHRTHAVFRLLAGSNSYPLPHIRTGVQQCRQDPCNPKRH